jgi:hypothetical protein
MYGLWLWLLLSCPWSTNGGASVIVVGSMRVGNERVVEHRRWSRAVKVPSPHGLPIWVSADEELVILHNRPLRKALAMSST